MADLTEAQEINNQAFKDGVESSSNNSDEIIYIDPKVFSSDDKEEQAKLFVEHLESQVPGSTKALEDKFQGSSNLMAEDMSKKGPFAVEGVNVSGKSYSVVNMPGDKFDSKDDIVEFFTHHLPFDVPTGAFKASDETCNRLIGVHEGTHLNISRDEYHSKKPSVLTGGHYNPSEEARADRAVVNDTDLIDDALNVIGASSKHADIDEYKDLRHLSSYNPDTATHATGPFLAEGKTNVRDEDFVMAKSYGRIMDGAVAMKLGYGSREESQKLLREDPDSYFKIVDELVEAQERDVKAAYQENPSSPEVIEGAVGSQVILDYIGNFKSTYEQRVLGRNVPEHEPTQLIPKEVEDNFYSELEGKNIENHAPEEHNNKDGDVNVKPLVTSSTVSSNDENYLDKPALVRSSSVTDETFPGEDNISKIIPISANFNYQVQSVETPLLEAKNDPVIEHQQVYTAAAPA